MSSGLLKESSLDASALTRPAFHAPADGDDRPAQPAIAVLRRERIYRRALAGADATAAVAAVLVSAVVAGVSVTWLVATVPLIVILIGKMQGLYDRDDMIIRKSTLAEWRSLTESCAISAICIYLLWGSITGAAHAGGMRSFALLWLSLAACTVLARTAARRIARAIAPSERCLIVGRYSGSTEVASRISELPGVELIGEVSGDQMNGSLSELRALVDRSRVHRLVVAPDGADAVQTLTLVRNAQCLGVRVSLLPGVLAAVGSCTVFDEVGGITFLGVPRLGLSRSSRALKRVFDLVTTGIAVVVLAPVFLLLAALIKLDSNGPVLFRQTRVGRNGRHFTMFKFRSMVVGAETMKPRLAALNEARDGLFKIANDPRVTNVGRWMRRMHLDELPQLWNVLHGEMSLVGPRPLIEEEDSQFAGADRYRLQLTPGITGPWQIRGPLTTPLSEMAKLDYMYIATWSLSQDMEILVKTATRMVGGAGH
jgi:exopolysaccharide biosynthesis polyprenyl glycosylphosphotransferase